MNHGGAIFQTAKRLQIEYKQLLDFSANINPLGMPENIKRIIIQNIDCLIHYPDIACEQLVEAIAIKEAIPSSFILCGNGAADLIYRFAYGIKPKKALLVQPTFLEYERALIQSNTEIKYISLNASFEVTSSILKEITSDYDVLFLCNPNNPTGLLIKRKFLCSLLEKAKQEQVLVVLDECFMDFVLEEKAYTCVSLLEQYPNLIILKSFTKLYAIAGLRLGYLITKNKEIKERIRQAGQEWSVNTMAQIVGVEALKNSLFLEETKLYIAIERVYLKEEMEKIGIIVWKGKANYLFFYIEHCMDLQEKLLEKQILIRNCGNYFGLTKEYYRVAIRTREENKKLIGAIREIFPIQNR